jgi:GntR family transcriptional regulator, carbon starvation induced regulator
MKNGRSMPAALKPQSGNAYDLLRQEILYGDLMPGERLRVAELNERYQFGLTPIREALVRLASEGLVSNESHRGARVRETTMAELADLTETRRSIERLCLTRSMARGDATWEAEIISAMHLLSRAALPTSPDDRATATQWEARHRRFHLSLVSACDSGWLLNFWNTLVDHSERYRKVRLLFHREIAADVRDLNAEHERIMKAVLARDVDRSTALMDEHLSRTEAAVARLMALDSEKTEGNPR